MIFCEELIVKNRIQAKFYFHIKTASHKVNFAAKKIEKYS